MKKGYNHGNKSVELYLGGEPTELGSIDIDVDVDTDASHSLGADEKQEYSGSFEIEIDEENTDTWLPFVTSPPYEAHDSTGAQCRADDTCVGDRRDRLVDAVSEPLSRMYARGFLDALFLATHLYAVHDSEPHECQYSDSA